MLTYALALTLALAGSQAGSPTFDPARVALAQTNYEAIMKGRKPIEALTPQELADVLVIADALKRPRDSRPVSERCVAEERERAGPNPSELTRRVIAMKCREPGERLD